MSLLLVLVVFGCAKKQEPSEEQYVELEYQKAVKALKKENYISAQQILEQLEEKYPYSERSKEINILMIYILYKKEQFTEMAPVADIYLKMYPNDKWSEYAAFMKFLAIYHQVGSYKRDKQAIKNAKESYQTMKNLHPSSQYSTILEPLYQYLIKADIYGVLDIGIWYAKTGNCLAAIPRFDQVLSMQGTTKDEEIITNNARKKCMDIFIH